MSLINFRYFLLCYCKILLKLDNRIKIYIIYLQGVILRMHQDEYYSNSTRSITLLYRFHMVKHWRTISLDLCEMWYCTWSETEALSNYGGLIKTAARLHLLCYLCSFKDMKKLHFLPYGYYHKNSVFCH